MTEEQFYSAALERATEVLGSTARAENWLDKMSSTLQCHPRELLSTKEGYERVLRHLHSVEIALDTD